MAEHAGSFGFVTKPIKSAELLSMVNSGLEERQNDNAD
jgi:hypothetical protein